MTGTILRLREPFIWGSCRIYPVVSETCMVTPGGMMGSVNPVALLIEDEGKLSCTVLEGDSITAVLEKLAGIPGAGG